MDFMQPLPPAMRVLRHVLLVCGALLLALVLLQYNLLTNKKTSLSWQLQDLQGNTATSASRFKTTSATDPDENGKAAAAQVLQKLDMPWNALFEALENAIDEEIVMLSVVPDAAQRSLMLQAMATDSAAAISFAERLQTSYVLADIHLLQEAPQEEGARFPLEFSINARWNADGDVP